MKKLILIILALLVVFTCLSLVAGCKKSGTTNTTTSVNAPANPHTDGRTACLVCHKDGTAGAPKIPSNHASYTDAMCANCHK